MNENETIVIKYTGPKEHIEAIKKIAKAYGGDLQEFLLHCIRKYLEQIWLPAAIPVSRGLFLHLTREARERGLATEAYINMLLTKHIVKGVKE
jgi:predicted DNA binding CopG/RHH family protein